MTPEIGCGWRSVNMRENQAFGVLLIALGASIFFFVAQLWARTKKDPQWILRGEFRERVRPGAAQIINAILMALGALTGTASVSWGLVLLRWV